MRHSSTPSRGRRRIAAFVAGGVGLLLATAGVVVALPSEAASTPGPAVGTNVWLLQDRSFADAMKQSRPYWGTVSDKLGDKCPVDADRWPSDDCSIVVWEGQADNQGTYKLSFKGRATVTADFGLGTFPEHGNASTLKAGDGYDAATNTTTATMVVTDAGKQNFVLTFTDTQRSGSGATNTGVTDVQLFRPTTPGSDKPYDVSTTFTPFLKDAVKPFTHLRFMAGTNWNSQATWADRTRPGMASQNVRLPGEQWEGNQVAWEYIVKFANEAGKDPWINIPVKVDDAYLQKLADLIKYGSDGKEPYTSEQANPVFPPLRSDLHLYLEYANELWNFGFQQFHDNIALAKAEVAKGKSPLNADGETGEFQLGARRTAERTKDISDVFRKTFGDAAMMTRIRPVLEWQADNGNNTAQLELEYLNTMYNNGDGVQHTATPHPVSYYVYGAGAAVYYNSKNDKAGSVDGIFAAGFPSDGYEKGVRTDSMWAKAYGLKYTTYEGGFAVGGDSKTKEQDDSYWDPRAEQTEVDAYGIWSKADADVVTVGTYAVWKDVLTASTWPLVKGVAKVNAPDYTAPAPTIGTTVPGGVAGDPAAADGVARYLRKGLKLDYVVRATDAGASTLTLKYTGNVASTKLVVQVNGETVATPTLAQTSGPTDAAAIPVTLRAGSNGIHIAVADGDIALSSLQIGSGGPAPSASAPGATPTSSAPAPSAPGTPGATPTASAPDATPTASAPAVSPGPGPEAVKAAAPAASPAPSKPGKRTTKPKATPKPTPSS